MATMDHIEARLQSTFSEDGWKDSGGHTVRLVLLTTAYAPSAGDENVHRTWSQVSANEVTGISGYATGGVAVTSKVIETSSGASTDTVYYNGAEVDFGTLGSGATIRWAMMLKYDTGTPANSKILKRYDLREGNSGNDIVTAGVQFRFVPTDSHYYARQGNPS